MQPNSELIIQGPLASLNFAVPFFGAVYRYLLMGKVPAAFWCDDEQGKAIFTLLLFGETLMSLLLSIPPYREYRNRQQYYSEKGAVAAATASEEKAPCSPRMPTVRLLYALLRQPFAQLQHLLWAFRFPGHLIPPPQVTTFLT